MPKGRRRHKKSAGRTSQARDRTGPKAFIVKDLLNKVRLSGNSITDRAASAGDWLDYLTQALGSELAPQVTAVVEQGGVLTVFASTSGWSARLRFAVAELAPQLMARAPRLKSVVVKVQRGA